MCLQKITDLSSRLIQSELSFKHKRIFLIVLISYPMAAVMVAIAFSGVSGGSFRTFPLAGGGRDGSVKLRKSCLVAVGA